MAATSHTVDKSLIFEFSKLANLKNGITSLVINVIEENKGQNSEAATCRCSSK